MLAILFIIQVVNGCVQWCSNCFFFLYSGNESTLEKEVDVFKDWTSKRLWKERKRAAKARAASPLQLTLQVSEPELIFYGQHSGVIGCTRDELFQIANDDELCTRGYDKVIVFSCSGPIFGWYGFSS